ncbi:hypothetical protein DRO32_00570 [Candidatus Bathyarchaeota archaeon]|nr:MAG: hypothetical protein DRO32_00570 [Candidatus Bathyarchaeota archaeon]
MARVSMGPLLEELLLKKARTEFQRILELAVEDCIREWCEDAKKRGLPPVFTTTDMVRVLAEKYPEIWLILTNLYPMYAGRRYTARNRIADILDKLAKEEKIRRKGFRRPAPPLWGAEEVAEYECIDP